MKVYLFLVLLISMATCKVRHHDICNTTTYPIPLEIGDGGVIAQVSDMTSEVKGSGKQDGCRLQLLGCDACHISVTLSPVSVPACSINHTDLPKYPLCVSGCSHVMMYEPSYADVTTHYYFSSNVTSSYTSLSSSIVIMFCNNGQSPDNTTAFSFSAHYNVLEKRHLYEGSHNNNHSWGWLESPNFPHGYAVRGEVYGYLIRNIDPGGYIRLTFDDWDLATSSMVTFYNNASSSKPLSVHVGSSMRPVVMSRGSQLYMAFQPDVGISSRADNMGFRAKYHFVQAAKWEGRPTTDCGMYYKYAPGGSIEFDGMRWGQSGFCDCVWVITKNSAFDWLYLTIYNLTLLQENSTHIVIRSGVTSDAPILANLTSLSNQSDGLVRFEGQDGFYIRLQGSYTSHDHIAMTFVAFNKPKEDGECEKSIEFQCRSGHCIDRHLVCDGHKHCRNGDDEGSSCLATPAQFIPLPRVCKPTEFPCRNGRRCIPKHSVCDHWLDCPDGSDEYSCGTTTTTVTVPSTHMLVCEEEEQLCHSQDQCIHKLQYCDGIYNCWDRSDEVDCYMGLQSSTISHAPWSILMPVGIALCIALFICVMTLCIRSHVKHQQECRAAYSSGRVPPHTRNRARRGKTNVTCKLISNNSGRTLRSVNSETPLTLNLSRSTSGVTVAGHMPDSPPSYEEAMRLSPEGCSVTGFSGSRTNGNGRHSPTMLSPPLYTPSTSDGASSPPSSVLNQTCFVFPAMADHTNSLPPPNIIQQPKEACSKCGSRRYFSFQSPNPSAPPLCGECSASLPKHMGRPHRRFHNKSISETVLNTIIQSSDGGSTNNSSSSEDESSCIPAESASAESDSQVNRLRESSTDSSSGRTQPSGDSMSRTPFSSIGSHESPRALPPPPPGACIRGSQGCTNGTSRSYTGSSGTNRSLPGSNGKRKPFHRGSSESNLKKMSRHSSLDEDKCTPIKPPPRTTSLIASLIERGAVPPVAVGLGRLYQAAPQLTTSKESVSSSRHSINSAHRHNSQSSLPIDSNFCDRIKKKVDNGSEGSSCGSSRPMLLNAASISSHFASNSRTGPHNHIKYVATSTSCDSGIALRAETPDLPKKTRHYGQDYKNRFKKDTTLF